MSFITGSSSRLPGPLSSLAGWGLFWLAFAAVGALIFLHDGLVELAEAWQLPEYSHGPLIPVLSALLFLRQLKGVPENPGPVADRWPGVAVLVAALVLGAAGRLLQIGDIVAYALILWVGGVLLVSFGWRTGRQFWPPVLHLVYMLPLPGALYYGLSIWLQGISSELGVWFLQMLRVPVFLEGNIIDLGVIKLHVAEACSGLRYLFPILSFSYIFAVLYRGPTWHKAVLLISAAPITVLMNAVRIALAGVIVNRFGPGHVEGFSHFFEGWVIFVLCVAMLFALAWLLLRLRRDRVGLIDALDLDTSGLGTQAMRLRHVQPSAALVTAGVLTAALAAGWAAVPEREPVVVAREPFALFPRSLGDWQVGPSRALEPEVAEILAADDYHSAWLVRPGAESGAVDLFLTWYGDQSGGGVHSPEVCLPGAGWEIARLERIAAPDGAGGEFPLNRAVIQKGMERMLVYYWFEQQGRRTASEFTAHLRLMTGRLAHGRGDSGLVRLITPLEPGESEAAAEARLQQSLAALLPEIPRFMPGMDGAR